MRETDSTIRLPRDIRCTTYEETTALIRKQIDALNWMITNPYARAMRLKVRNYFAKRSFAVVEFPK